MEVWTVLPHELVLHSPNSLFDEDGSELDGSQHLPVTFITTKTSSSPIENPHPSLSTPAEEDDGKDFKPARFFVNPNRSILPVQPIPGLYYLPRFIDHSTELDWMNQIGELNLDHRRSHNQMMFFSHLKPAYSPGIPSDAGHVDDRSNRVEGPQHSFLSWPKFLVELIDRLPSLLSKVNPNNLDGINDLFFGPQKSRLPWQVIINMYKPGEGIEQHVDLIDRFDEIILGISLGSSVTMQFESTIDQPPEIDRIQRLYLEQCSGYIISRQARFVWTHGISANRSYDWVHDDSNDEIRKILRLRTRVSITIRRLKPNADLLQASNITGG